MGAEGEHLLHSVLQGPRLLPSHDAAVSTSDLKAWCILGREKLNKLRRHTCSQQPQPGHEASVLLARTSHIPSWHPHDVGLGSVVQPCAQEEKTGLVVMVSLCHIQDTCSFILQLFFSLSSICCCLFKREKSGCDDYLLLLPNKNMLSFTEIRSPFTMLAHSGLSPPEGWRPVRWYSVGNWQHWVSAKAGRPLTWHLVTFLLSPLGPPFAIWCSQQGCNPNQMWDLVRWSCRGGGASVGSVHCFGQRMLLDTLAMFLSNPESLSSNRG